MVAGPPLPQSDISAGRLADALNTLDTEAKRAVAVAHHEAYRYASGFLASTHLLLGLVADDTPRGPDDEKLLDSIRRQVQIYTGPAAYPVRPIHLAYTPHARAIVINAAELARRGVGTADTTPDHLWSALKAARGCLAVRCLAAVPPLAGAWGRHS